MILVRPWYSSDRSDASLICVPVKAGVVLASDLSDLVFDRRLMGLNFEIAWMQTSCSVELLNCFCAGNTRFRKTLAFIRDVAKSDGRRSTFYDRKLGSCRCIPCLISAYLSNPFGEGVPRFCLCEEASALSRIPQF